MREHQPRQQATQQQDQQKQLEEKAHQGVTCERKRENIGEGREGADGGSQTVKARATMRRRVRSTGSAALEKHCKPPAKKVSNESEGESNDKDESGDRGSEG